MMFKYHILNNIIMTFALMAISFFIVGHAYCQTNDSIKLSLSLADAECHGETVGILINIAYGKAPFSYKLQHNIAPAKMYTGSFKKNKYKIEDIDTGLYFFQIADVEGKLFQQQVHIQTPPKLEAGIITVPKEKRGKGKLMANPHGGTPPYAYEWISQEGVIANTQVVKRLENGIYKVKIQDANNCGPEEATIFFTEKTKN